MTEKKDTKIELTLSALELLFSIQKIADKIFITRKKILIVYDDKQYLATFNEKDLAEVYKKIST